jgi:protein-L-isoaspartate(D-aspartate) O-methyltransferase
MGLLLLIFSLLRNSQPCQADKFTLLREQMVNQQIIARGITDAATIDAMKKVPRHLFVPYKIVNEAYEDSPLPIGYGQTISQPYVVALMTEVTEPSQKKKVLEIGTGSGYQAAIFAEIVDSVYTIEIVPELAGESLERFKRLGYKNIVSKYGDGYKGWTEHAPFDIIVVTAAPERIPEPLVQQLAENGRMIIPVGDAWSLQKLILLTKKNGKISEKYITTVRFVPFKRLNN